MSILIPGMEMPKDCGHCLLCEMDTVYDAPVYRCLITYNYLDDGYESQIMSGCPLVPVPDHGRLIDADALAEMLEKYKKKYALKATEDIVNLHKAWGLHEAELMAESLPTIISAEPSKEGEG